jgi:hypothetical protein
MHQQTGTKLLTETWKIRAFLRKLDTLIVRHCIFRILRICVKSTSAMTGAVTVERIVSESLSTYWLSPLVSEPTRFRNLGLHVCEPRIKFAKA